MLEIVADYCQFYVWDGGVDPQAPEVWSEADVQRAVKVAEHVVVVCPIRNMSVPVELEVSTSEPSYDLEAHDHVVLCSLRISSGCLQVHECTGGEKLRLSVAPGVYKVLVLFSNLGALSADGLEGKDRYRVVLWPGVDGPLQVLKQWPGEWGG